ncbi:hypothetical protein B5M45_16955 [Mycobacterium simiae]|uniref:Uncharacterized protein n=1 Tax=Mycobacterium simiae TaxID=1784 RepID=A0A1X0Y157_MYCSI|nr:hypothetical protein B5M45_16955 [Mycobacterium simiae]
MFVLLPRMSVRDFFTRHSIAGLRDGIAARLLREESPAITRVLTDSTDAIAIDNGTEAPTTLLTAFTSRRPPPPFRRRPIELHRCRLRISNLTTSSTTAITIALAGHEITANLLGATAVRLPHTPA